MEKDILIKKTVEKLREMDIPYQINNGSDISLSATLKKEQEDNNDTKVINYFVSLFFNEEKNIVYAYQKVMLENEEISKNSDHDKAVIRTTNNNESYITISSVLDSISAIANSMGLTFEKTENMQTNLNSDEYKNIDVVGLKSENATQSKSISYRQSKKSASKSLKPLITLVVILIIIGITVAVVILTKNFINKNSSPSTSNKIEPEATAKRSNSAVVSSGVKSSDLGNIMNGQYYFSTNQYIFYSSYDENDKAHIYSVKNNGTEHKSIFDGFGWSLVVINDWLYFSGNQGEQIDGTYNIFRIKLDGSKLEKINDKYSYGMFLYDNYLYYLRSSGDNQSSLSICRSSLDGSNEEVLFSNGSFPVIYENKLYYIDNLGNMYRSNPDGKEPQVLLNAIVKAYVLSEDKIVYFDNSSNIYTCDLDGKNNKLIRSSSMPVNNINAYDGRIFFSEYDTNFNYTYYGYNYTIKSCNIDGSDEKSVFSSVSYGIYMNLVNNKLMLMDYVRNQSTSEMYAIIKSMDLNGDNVVTLER